MIFSFFILTALKTLWQIDFFASHHYFCFLYRTFFQNVDIHNIIIIINLFRLTIGSKTIYQIITIHKLSWYLITYYRAVMYIDFTSRVIGLIAKTWWSWWSHIFFANIINELYKCYISLFWMRWSDTTNKHV